MRRRVETEPPRMMPSHSEAARRLPMFAELDDEAVGQLLIGAEVRQLDADTILFTEGDVPEYLHVLMNGIVELYKTSASRDCGLMLLTAGDVFMPAAAVFDEPYLNSARSLTQSKVLFLRAEVVRAEIALRLQLALNISRVLAGQFRMATRQIIDLKSLTAVQRLGAFLLRLADASGDAEGARLPVAKRHLASRVGMTPETLSRALQILAAHGLLVRGTRVLVRDRNEIDAYLGSPPYALPAEAGLDVHVL